MASLSTYMDVSQATRGASASKPEGASEVSVRAQVLSRISAGVEREVDLLDKSDLAPDVARAALDWLSQSGLIEIEQTGDERRFSLTGAAKTALGDS